MRESQISGVYEVIMGRNAAYTDDTGRYMIFGHLFDMQEQKDLTAAVLEKLNRVDVSALPRGDAIKTVHGEGKRQFYVFSDPDCPYCQQLEKELVGIDNVTVYTYLFPLVGLHPDAYRKAVAIWCANDRPLALFEFMTSGKLSENGDCPNPVDRNIRLGNSLGINGTPTIIFDDGAIHSGLLPVAEIERRLVGR